MKCYKDLKTLVVEAGYSAAALTGRLEVLEKAMNDAVSTVTKDDKKETPSIPVVTIAHYQLPGALALLEQVIKLCNTQVIAIFHMVVLGFCSYL